MSANPATTDLSKLTVRQLQPLIGAEISGVDLRAPLSTADRDLIWSALLQHHVVFFRKQNLSRAQFAAFGRSFGELVLDVQGVDGFPYIQPVRSGIGGQYTRATWHADATYRPDPFFASILISKEVPPLGGDTVFSSAADAYAGLDEAIRARIANLSAVHAADGKAYAVIKDKEAAAAYIERYAGTTHPVVVKHPYTGETLLYVNNGFAKRFVEIEGPEADNLMLQLKYQFTLPEYQVRFKWEPDSIAFWDNRAVQHYGVGDYGENYRYFERVVLAGPEPVRA